MTLGEAIGSVVATLAGVESRPEADGSTSWSIEGEVFAILSADGGAASFRLDPVLAAAARRTPDATESPRGVEWVAFAPVVVDAHAIDRAGAWASAAYRRARR
ncbi:MAG TPA: hypothetical protein VGQ89_01905 [Candidatus Limnocylindrales bacterium]|jgi:hypothetical protein|nr:hypothetical protein [Candidatus Limnocylindrales bacterium]